MTRAEAIATARRLHPRKNSGTWAATQDGDEWRVTYSRPGRRRIVEAFVQEDGRVEDVNGFAL